MKAKHDTVNWIVISIISTTALLAACSHKNVSDMTREETEMLESLAVRQQTLNEADKSLEAEGYLAGTVTCLCASLDGQTVLAIWRQRPRTTTEEPLENGVFRSTDKGNTWIKSETGLPAEDAKANDLIRHPEKDVFFLALKLAVYRSDDLGASWFPVTPDPQPEYGGWFTRITLDPITGDLYARQANDGYGVHWLPSGTANWIAIGEGLLEHWSADDVAFCPADNVVYAATGTRGVVMIEPPEDVPRAFFAGKNANGTFRWTEERGLPVMPHIPTVLAYTEINPNTGEAWTGTYQGLFRKTDGQWTTELERVFILDVAFEIGGTQRVVAWTMDDFYLKSEGEWRTLPTPWDRLTWIRCAAFCGETLYVGTNRGLYSTEDPVNGPWQLTK